MLRPGALTRLRLLHALLQRWEHRVTFVTGGAGLGKTTLLAQALRENRLAPRGDDVWLAAEPHDDDAAHLCADLVAALGGAPSIEPRASAVADLVWKRAPTPVCLVIDDAHSISTESAGF